MKFVKLSIVAMAMGLFVASCGNNENAENKTEDSTAMAPAPEATPAPAPAAADTAMKADTAAKAATADTAKKM
jgi:hypothetical protein